MLVSADLALKTQPNIAYDRSSIAKQGILVFPALTELLTQAQTEIPRVAQDEVCVGPYFQKGFFKPAGARALFGAFISVPESSEIFSSCKRDDGACSSSSLRQGVIGEEYSEFIGTSTQGL